MGPRHHLQERPELWMPVGIKSGSHHFDKLIECESAGQSFGVRRYVRAGEGSEMLAPSQVSHDVDLLRLPTSRVATIRISRAGVASNARRLGIDEIASGS